MPESQSHHFAYVEPERHDELSAGTPDSTQASATLERKAGATGIPTGASIIPAMGGRARKGSTKLTHAVDLPAVTDLLKRRARFMRRRTCSELARNVGAGECGIIPSALVKLASEDMALREAALVAGQIDLARRLGESARMHLLYAREVAVKDASARPRAKPDELPIWMEYVEEEPTPKEGGTA